MAGIVLDGDIVYHWTVDGEELNVDESTIKLSWTGPGVYIVQASYSVNGCMSPETVVQVEVFDDDPLPDIYPEPFFTPNGDGVNDTWEIRNIEYYPNANIEIFDRFSRRLVVYKGSEQGWDGYYNGHPMPSTDYWYYIRGDKLATPRSGHFILKR